MAINIQQMLRNLCHDYKPVRGVFFFFFFFFEAWLSKLSLKRDERRGREVRGDLRGLAEWSVPAVPGGASGAALLLDGCPGSNPTAGSERQ